VSLLVDIDSSVDTSVCLERSEHSSLTALVTEGGLAGTVSTRTTDSGNTSNSSTSSPGLSGVSHTSSSSGGDLDSGSLLSVLVEVGVDLLDDVGSDGGDKDSG